MRTNRIIDRGLYRCHSRKVHNGATSPNGIAYGLCIRDVANDQLNDRIIRQIAALAGRQIVQYPNGIASSNKCINQVRADEPGPSGNQNRQFSHDGNNAPVSSAAPCARHAA